MNKNRKGSTTFRRSMSAPHSLFIGCAFAIMGCMIHEAKADAPPVKSLLEMRHENVVIQKWDLSCGAAALATLLKYQHGQDVTEREVAIGLMKREEYIRNPKLVQIREGFSLLDLKRDVDARGFHGAGYGKLKIEDALAKAPLIVPLSINGYNHFVILRGMMRDRVLLADPAWGNRTMSVTEFMDRWIDYPTIGHIGFTVERRDDVVPPNLLKPKPEDFVAFD